MYRFMISLLAMLLLSATAMAQDIEEVQRCDYCGMFWERSSTRLVVEMLANGRESSLHFESLGCLMNSMTEMKADGDTDIKVQSAMILDYATFGTKQESMIDAMKAWYLVDTKRLKGSMAPFIAAFTSQEGAASMQEDLGGDVMNHDQMHAWFRARQGGASEGSADEDGMQAGAAVYICPCEGDCCDDIMSDKPGECERCGMELVLKTDK